MKTPFTTHCAIALTAVALFFLAGLSGQAITYNWTNQVSGTWGTSANWLPNGVPSTNDTAIITNAGVTVTLSAASGAGGIILGTNGPGTVTLSLGNQTLTLNGPLTVNPSGSFTVDSGLVTGYTNAVLRGNIAWTSGLLEGTLTLATGSTLTVTAANVHDLPTCVFTNNGTVTWVNGQVRGGPGSVVYNNGLWDCQSDQSFNNAYSGTPVFNNLGILRKSGGASELASDTVFSGVLINQLAGMIDVQNGTNGLQLNFAAGGNFTGGFITTNVNGLTVLGNGSFNVNGTLTGTNTWEDAGNLTGTNVINGSLTWVAGNWNSAPFVTIATNSTLIVLGGTGNEDMDTCVVTNSGTVAWVSGTIRGGTGTVINNYGLWNCESDQSFNNAYAGTPVFNNFGILRKSGGASEFANNTVFSGVLINQLAGMIDVQNGTNGLQLNFATGGNFTGGYVTTNVNGLTVLGNGNFTVNGTLTGTNTWQDAGNLAGNNVINGSLTWVAGNWNSATVTISPNSTVIVAGGTGNNDINGGSVTNYGTLAWVSGNIRSGGTGAAIYNYGLWNAMSDESLNNAFGSYNFNNFGTFRKSAGSNTLNTLVTSGVFFNQTNGVVDVQTGNLTLQGGGDFSGGYTTTNSTGTTYLSAGSFNINGAVTSSNVIQNAGNLTGTNVIKGALIWVAGTWNGATVTITTNSMVTVAGGTGNNDINAGTVTNLGTLAWLSGNIRTGAGAIYNYGLWNAMSDEQMNDAFGSDTFNNFGTFRKSAGSNTLNTLLTGGVFFNQPSGVLDVQTGNLALQGSGSFTGGYVTTNTTGITYLSVGTFNINGTATGTNVVENSASLTGNNVIKGALEWVAGTWDNATVTILTNSTVIVAGGTGDNDVNGGSITNYGTFTWVSGTIRGGVGSLNNYGLWNSESDEQMNNAFGSYTFNNFGIFQKSGGTGSTTITTGVLFDQTAGILMALTGNILLQGGGNLTGGTVTGTSLGTTYLSLGNFTINGATTTGNVVENSGSLTGNNLINGVLTWVAGTWDGAAVTITNGSTVTIAGGSGGNNDVNGGVVTNYGTVAWASGNIRGGVGIYNYGLWNAQSDQSMNNTFQNYGFYNYGTLLKTGGTGSTVFTAGIGVTNTGTINAQNGNIALNGAYSLANGTVMDFGLGGVAGNGSISLSGAAAFTGSLGVNLRGYFWPGAGSSYTLLNYTSVTGIPFANESLPGTGYLSWQTNYNATAFVLSMLARIGTNTAPTNIIYTVQSPTNLFFQWPGDHTGWRLQGQTNPITVGITNDWAAVSGAQLTNQFNMPFNTTNATVFFRMIDP